MFISALELFKIGIGPSSSHTLGPMIAASRFISSLCLKNVNSTQLKSARVRCTLKGSLAYTGKGHATDRAVVLGLNDYSPESLVNVNVDSLIKTLWTQTHIRIHTRCVLFNPETDILFDRGEPLPAHPNGLIFELHDSAGELLFSQTYYSIGGGFICTEEDIGQLSAPLKMKSSASCKYPFDSAKAMLEMAHKSGKSVARMKQENELAMRTEKQLEQGLDNIWLSMKACVENGLSAEGTLPGGLNLRRRAKRLHQQLKADPQSATLNDWLCCYAMAVNEENATGHMVVTAPTNGAAGVIAAVLYYWVHHQHGDMTQVRDFLLTAAAIGGLIKHLSSISGAEVGCQGEVGAASAMAAAGLCAIRGGSVRQVENAAEIALEHHLGLTCDPVGGLVQVPCIERNGFGAIKAYTAASLALREDGSHFMPLDACIAAMKQTGQEMSQKFKETALGGLAVSITEC